MNELDESITDIDDGDKVHAKLKAIGARHKKHGIISSNIFLVSFFFPSSVNNKMFRFLKTLIINRK